MSEERKGIETGVNPSPVDVNVITYQDAFIRVVSEIQKDEGLHIAWKSNIAMAFVDRLHWAGIRFPQLHELANEAADNFLLHLINRLDDDE